MKYFNLFSFAILQFCVWGGDGAAGRFRGGGKKNEEASSFCEPDRRRHGPLGVIFQDFGFLRGERVVICI